MKSLRLNETEVCTSTLTQRAYGGAPCEILVYITPANQERAIKEYADYSHRFSGMHVEGLSDLSFLKNFPNLRYLEVVGQKDVNTRYLDGLNNLCGLRLETPGAGIDFSCFPKLTVFVGDWHKDNVNVSHCYELRQLRVWHFNPKSRDVAEFAYMPRLEWLDLVQTGIRTMEGLECLEDLRYFEISYASKLESLSIPAVGSMQL